MRAPKSSYGLLLTAVAMAQGTTEPTAVEGTVIHSITGVPVARAHIALRGSGQNPKIYGAVTTAEGKFSIAGVAPGAYQALAERVDFMPAGPGGRATVDVTVRPGFTKEDLKFRLAPLGSISGRVVDKEGEPVEAAAVSIETGPVSSTIFDITDDKGQFRLVGLQPGRYRVRAAVSRALPVTSRPEIRTDGSVELRYAPTYAGGVTDYKSATRIEVETGAEIAGVEIRLAQMPMTRISGKVIGVPPEARGVGLRFTQIYGARAGSGSVQKDGGAFEFWNIDPGKYFLAAGWSSSSQTVQTAPVNLEIGQTSIGNVELRLVPPSDMQGQIVYEDEQARPQPNGPKPKLEVRTVDPVSAQPTVSEVAPDGSFRLTGVAPARYRVMLSWPTAWVKAVTLGTNQVEGNVLNLRGGANGASLTVLLSSAFGTIGRVLDGDNPVAGARIALLRDDFVSLGDVTFTASDASGAYTIPNVRPGKYRLAAIEEIDEGPRAGNMDDYEDVLARIDVQPKDNVTKDLKRHRPVK